MNELEPLRAAIAAAVAAPARELLQAYFDSDGTFAGETFDRLVGDEQSRERVDAHRSPRRESPCPRS